MRKERFKGIALLVLMCALWGATFPLVKALLKVVNAFELLSLRFLFASCFSLPFVLPLIRRQKAKKLVKVLVLGVFLWLAYVAQTVGLEFTTPSKSAFITGLYIVFTPVFAALIARQKITKSLYISVLLALVGLFLVSGISLSETSLVNKGDLITVVSAIAFALQIVMTSILVKDIDMRLITGFQMFVVFLLSFAMTSFSISFDYPFWVLASLVFLGTVGGYVAILVETYGLKYVDPGTASIIFTLEPIFAFVLSVSLLKETLTLRVLFGFAFIIASIAKVAKSDTQ